MADEFAGFAPAPDEFSGFKAPTPPPTVGDRVQKMLGTMAAPVEEGYHLATGAAALPLAGLAGLGTAYARNFGLKADPVDIQDAVQDYLTYKPRTPEGQDLQQKVADIGGVLQQGANFVGNQTEQATGSPTLGAAADVYTQAAEQLLGMKAGPGLRALSDVPLIKPTTNLISEMLPGGASRAANRLIQQYAETPDAAADTIQTHLDAQRSLQAAGNSGALAAKGFQPTTAQVAGNSGLAQMERTLRNQPDMTQEFGARDADNQGAIENILRTISGTPEERLRAGAARDFMARTMYDDALNNPEHLVQPPGPEVRSFAAEEAAKRGLPSADGTPSTNDPNAPPAGLNDIGTRLQELLKRPAMDDAMANASRIAANLGKPLDQRNLIQQMHYAKMHLDDQIGAAKAANKPNDLRALVDTKNELLEVMDSLSPAYAQARQAYTAMSRPVNRMDLGEALRQKWSSALRDAGGVGTRPASFADALRRDDGDTIARTATGFNGATLQGTLRPADVQGLDMARDQMAREQYASSAGRAVGSPTGANLASQRMLDNIGSVRQIGEDMGHGAPIGMMLHHPAVAVATGILGGAARAASKAKLADMALSPELALKALRAPTGVRLPVGLTAAPGVAAEQPEARPQNFWDLNQP